MNGQLCPFFICHLVKAFFTISCKVDLTAEGRVVSRQCGDGNVGTDHSAFTA